VRAAIAALAAVALLSLTAHSQPASRGGSAPAGARGLREPAWSPDGKRLAVAFLDRIFTVSPEGRDAKPLGPDIGAAQREPVWSDDGRVAFAMDGAEGFDIYVARPPHRTRDTPERVTNLAGDERSPTWTPDGRIVFAHRAAGARQWDLYLTAPANGGWSAPQRLTDSDHDEVQPRVSPDGGRVAFASDRESDEGDVDIWAMRVPAADERVDAKDARWLPVRLVQARGTDGYPSWSPDGDRLAFYAVREGVGSTWVAPVDSLPAQEPGTAAAEPARGRVARLRPSHPPQLVSRHGGAVAWSPDGRTIAIGEVPDPEPTYNGNPHRSGVDAPPVFGLGRAYQLWIVPAPRPIDEGGRTLTPALTVAPASLAHAFDRVWATLDELYYSAGAGRGARLASESAVQWQALRDKYRPLAQRARTLDAIEEIADRMIAEQPLIKPAVVSSRAVVVAGHPLASEAGRSVLEKGGNIVDAAIAVSFVLGVVEPDASGIGGDGQAVLYLTSMSEPTVVEYKDQTPMRATLDNPTIFRNGRLVGDGPAAANIPGVVAGLEHLYKRYGSGRVKWAELIEPAIRYAEDGFILDEGLPSSLAEGRQYLSKYEEAARVYLPGGRVPNAGERFVNADYADTLRTLAREGAEAFYRGSIARRIAADMQANGGIMTYEDLAQYHAVERKAVAGRYRGHVLYTGGPPVGSGVSLFEALQVLANYPAQPGAMPAADADYWHHMIEAWKVRDPIRRIADPAHWPVDYDLHLQPAHAQELFRRIDPARAGRFPETADDQPGSRIGSGTTSFVVADADGNMIAVTQTLSTWGGAFYVSKGLGFLYNNHLRSSRTTRGGYGQLLPLMRSSTTSVPTLIFRDSDGARLPRMAIGVAGNAWIPASAYSTIAAVIDGGLPMQRAIEAPRFLVARDPADPLGTGARIEIEDRFPRATLEALIQRGHRFQKIGRKGELRYGYAAAALVDPIHRRVEGGSEPRRSHMAAAVGDARLPTAQQ
jgi:gamma-glutamyltranspeptidase/glutathione hydrolase